MSEVEEKLRTLVVEKDEPLNASNLIETANPNKTLSKQHSFQIVNESESELPEEEQALNDLPKAQRLAILESREQKKLQKLTELGLTEESKKDLARLEEVRKERELIKERRELQKVKKEELRKKAAERGKLMEEKLNAKKKGKKKRK